ncbi:tRNA (adenosine(37)-N6)-threonylcarbamoyltransferase complex ATPase subunit type 1 TsaE [Alicyclobacillus shizuokensis]|uniref:tRNA (adenosine(37)-N6)-threonylcarbamoyltransferase complex ATPase subunit type 1 TsaE n=1 Tax=Alicyclobacillus shizuokensis TaxID=392014 RepID=UPI00082F3779|nr:tRNA (adenosine(37)-N6)-threonylcarbamoyltransferase complex ATPase subunit type 1 TsaE [Alicyclobacillus shizuokensis]MCL6626357.1 tRNA (adenosine(37)-N6)-threonylcarbamoyltransferase complex ATPase subunit type 1 TsaE [Alicyclobacillus shizuokensis]
MVDAMTFTTQSAQETKELGRVLGRLLKPADVVLLSGDLGTGKTTFAKGVAEGLGIGQEVTSPTFTLIAEYEDGRIPFVHMDLYRLYEEGGPMAAELDEIGFSDYLEGRAAVLIEWPKAVLGEMEDALTVHIARQPLPRVDERAFSCRALGPRSWQRLDEWVKRWLF